MAADYSLLIEGVEKGDYVLLDSIAFQGVVNGVDTLQFDLDSPLAAYRPSIRDRVIWKENGVPIISGRITSAPEECFGGPALSDIVTRVSVASMDVVTTYVNITATIAAGSLKSQLTAIVAYLSSHGITLDAGQVDGPDMPELNLVNARIDGVLNTLSATTGYQYLWDVTASDTLRMYDPASNPAPFDVLDTGDINQIGDMKVEPTLDEEYANRVKVIVNGAGDATSTEEFTAADGVPDGSPATYIYFTTKYPAGLTQDDAWPNEFLFQSGGSGPFVNLGPIGRVGEAEAAGWNWDAANHRLRFTVGSGATYPAGADAIQVTYAIRYPFEVEAENSADIALYGLREKIVTVDQPMTIEAAQALADSLVDTSSVVQRKVYYDTLSLGARTGMSQTITQAKRDLDEFCVILEMSMAHETDDEPGVFRCSITAVPSAGKTPRSFRDVVKRWLGGGSSSSGMVTQTGGGQPSGGNVITPTTWGNDPASPDEGDAVVYSDAPSIGIYDGADWLRLGPIFPVTPFVDSGFAWNNQGSATKAVDKGVMYMTAPAQTGYSVRSYLESAPSTPYTVTALLQNFFHSVGTPVFGLVLRESGTNKLITFGMGSASSGSPALFYFSNDTTLTTNLDTRTYVPLMYPGWFRIENDGTNLKFYSSQDGVNWYLHLSEAKNTRFTTGPDQIGLAISSNANTSVVCSGRCYSYKKA